MTDPLEPVDRADLGSLDGNKIEPLPGEPGIPNVAERRRAPMSKKGLLAVALLMLSII
ncbi:MAG: type IV secretion system protein VirB10, partial [Burkholderiaceae bacterium]|nr:type IV secretion system protein VirB10 [Burkholderiaceae bacterium]